MDDVRVTDTVAIGAISQEGHSVVGHIGPSSAGTGVGESALAGEGLTAKQNPASVALDQSRVERREMDVHDQRKPGGQFGNTGNAPGAVHLMEDALTYMGVPGSPALPLPPQQVAGRLWEFQTSQITDRTFGSKGAAE